MLYYVVLVVQLLVSQDQIITPRLVEIGSFVIIKVIHLFKCYLKGKKILVTLLNATQLGLITNLNHKQSG